MADSQIISEALRNETHKLAGVGCSVESSVSEVYSETALFDDGTEIGVTLFRARIEQGIALLMSTGLTRAEVVKMSWGVFLNQLAQHE